jgi:hypothetical protein
MKSSKRKKKRRKQMERRNEILSSSTGEEAGKDTTEKIRAIELSENNGYDHDNKKH